MLLGSSAEVASSSDLPIRERCGRRKKVDGGKKEGEGTGWGR